jgi:hypothetical protein
MQDCHEEATAITRGLSAAVPNVLGRSGVCPRNSPQFQQTIGKSLVFTPAVSPITRNFEGNVPRRGTSNSGINRSPRLLKFRKSNVGVAAEVGGGVRADRRLSLKQFVGVTWIISPRNIYIDSSLREQMPVALSPRRLETRMSSPDRIPIDHCCPDLLFL